MTKRAIWLSLVLALAATVLSVVAAAPATSANTQRFDIEAKHAREAVRNGVLPLERAVTTQSTERAGQASAGVSTLAADPPLGTKRMMPVLDDVFAVYRIREFTLRAIGEHVEIWVQTQVETTGFMVSGTNFLPGDCRNGRTTITDAQLASMVHEFDTNMYPKESDAFSVPPARDGTNAVLTEAGFGEYTGDGDKIVTLVSNVRDENFYALNNPTGLGYIAGFFSSQVNDFLDRNVMTIDAFDWLHRTGANPPNDPVPGDFCKSAPARPFLYEGVFAHEYQHLLESYEDPDEFSWINEGLADWAQTLTGYVKPSVPITDNGFDSHVQCFLGWSSVQTDANPNPRPGGPENSLTRWSDQGDGEILCDYGAAYTMMEFLHGRYGTGFMSALHRGDANGFAGLQEALSGDSDGSRRSEKKRRKTTVADVLHDWSLMVALDGLVDRGAELKGSAKEKDVVAPTLDATINWDTPDAYSTPGSPSNGADYVRLRDAQGNYLTGSQINALSFQGQSTLSRPVAWTVDPAAPLGADGPSLYSGAADNRDEAIVRPISVGTGAAATLTFAALWNEELDWDFGFVQISTDDGATYESLACTNTTTQINPDALPTAQDNIPGFSGFSGDWLPQTCSLAAYAGQNVLLAFRAFNDPAFVGQDPSIPAGFWVDNVSVGGQLVSDGSSLAGWKSFSETRPMTVAGYTVFIVSMNSANLDKRKQQKDEITVKRLKLTSDFTIRGSSRVGKYIDKDADFVAAIVMHDDPTEVATDYARYALVVNGVVQPGGQ